MLFIEATMHNYLILSRTAHVPLSLMDYPQGSWAKSWGTLSWKEEFFYFRAVETESGLRFA